MAARPLSPLVAIVVAGALAFGVFGQAKAQIPLDQPLDEHAAQRLDRMEKVVKELRAIVFQGRETGAPVVVQPAETQGQIAGLSDRLADLEQTLAKLNGELEIIRHDLDQSRKEASDLRASNAALKEQVAALDRSLQALSTPPPPPPPPEGAADSQPPASSGAAADDPAAAFAAAKGAFVAGDMTSAEAGFHAYVDRWGDGPDGPEARYYLARTLVSRRAWPEAATADIGAIRGWPRTRWAPQAVLDLSRSLYAMDKGPDACQTLDELARRYPAAAANVRKAAAQLRAQAKCE